MTNLQRNQEETRARFELLHVFNPTHLTFETGVKDMKEFLDEEVEKAFKSGQQDMLERVRGKVPYECDLPDRLINPFYPNEGEKYLDMKANQQYKKGFNTCREETLKALDNLNQR